MKEEMKPEIAKQFEPFAEKMAGEGLPPLVIDTFRHYYTQINLGKTGLITGAEIEPVADGELADADNLPGFAATGRSALERLVIIKLNGGLGTSMGLSRAKSLLEVRKGLTFLDIIARQVLTHRRKLSVRLPVVFMNSFHTEADTLEALAPYSDLAAGIPLTFVQHKFLKVMQKNLSPAAWTANPELEWNPPGHGDIYTALVTSGMLRRLLDQGIRYAFISNSDNLGAMVDESILGYFAGNGLAFMMEVTDRTVADNKGGHLARLKNGRLTLREIAQCPQDERDQFKDVNLYRYFNTNNIWVDLYQLKELLASCNSVLPLSFIINSKTLDPRDDSSPLVYQLETAMGSAISVFDKATAIRVPRTRFAPVKKCHDLLAVRSDCYVLTDDYFVVPNPDRPIGPPLLRLDQEHYKRINQLEARFPHGPPSLLECVSLDVEGDVVFDQGVVVRGNVLISNRSGRQVAISAGSLIEEDMLFT